LAAKPKNSNKKSLRHKPLRLSLTKQLKNSNGCIRNAINFICNGKRLLRTQEEETRLSLKKVKPLACTRTSLTIKRVNLRLTRPVLNVKKKTTGALKDKFKDKSANLLKSVKLTLVQMKKRRIWKAKWLF
jgi:hypothetical protein